MRGSYEKYKALPIKDADTLYFLDNHQIYLGNHLLSMIETAPEGFPQTLSLSMTGRYYISLTTGLIYYVNNAATGQVTNLSQIMIGNIEITAEFVQKVVAYFDIEEVKMPTLTVDTTQKSLVWTPAQDTTTEESVEKIKYYRPKKTTRRSNKNT